MMLIKFLYQVKNILTAIWAKSKENFESFIRNLLVLFFITHLVGCLPQGKISSNKLAVNTEIFCPSFSYRFLVIGSTRQDVAWAIENAIKQNEASNQNSNYTILYFANGRSTSIYNVTPQELKRFCALIEKPRNPYPISTDKS